MLFKPIVLRLSARKVLSFKTKLFNEQEMARVDNTFLLISLLRLAFPKAVMLGHSPIFLNTLPDILVYSVYLLFADNFKINKTIGLPQDCLTLQLDLNNADKS